MTQDEVVQIVLASDAGFREATRQRQYNQVRFYGEAEHQSVNIGYSEPQRVFIADFVFMGGSPEFNAARVGAFVLLFGGELSHRSTQFARLKPEYSQVRLLKQLVQAYAALKPVTGA